MDSDTNRYIVGLKAKAMDIHGRSPYQNHERTITKISYTHDVDNQAFTIELYSGSRRYKYICSETDDCPEMVKLISAELDKTYADRMEDESLHNLLF